MRSDLPHYQTYEEVMFFDTDIGGVVHNLAYLRMIETCRTKLATTKLGMDLKSMANNKTYPVVLKTEINYHFPATLGHKLKITGKLESVEKVRFWCQFEIYAEGVEQRLITCRQSLALVRIDSNATSKPQRLPKEWRERWS